MSLTPESALTIARPLLPGRMPELAVAIGWVESRLNPDQVGDNGDSLGALQVNIPTWGAAAAPMGAAAGATPEARWRAQLIAARDAGVFKAAAEQSLAVAEKTGLDVADLFNLFWQFSPPTALELVKGLAYWDPASIVARIAAKLGAKLAGEWQQREADFTAMLEHLLALGAGAGVGVLFLVALALSRSKRR